MKGNTTKGRYLSAESHHWPRTSDVKLQVFCLLTWLYIFMDSPEIAWWCARLLSQQNHSTTANTSLFSLVVPLLLQPHPSPCMHQIHNDQHDALHFFLTAFCPCSASLFPLFLVILLDNICLHTFSISFLSLISKRKNS